MVVLDENISLLSCNHIFEVQCHKKKNLSIKLLYLYRTKHVFVRKKYIKVFVELIKEENTYVFANLLVYLNDQKFNLMFVGEINYL